MQLFCPHSVNGRWTCTPDGLHSQSRPVKTAQGWGRRAGIGGFSDVRPCASHSSQEVPQICCSLKPADAPHCPPVRPQSCCAPVADHRALAGLTGPMGALRLSVFLSSKPHPDLPPHRYPQSPNYDQKFQRWSVLRRRQGVAQHRMHDRDFQGQLWFQLPDPLKQRTEIHRESQRKKKTHTQWLLPVFAKPILLLSNLAYIILRHGSQSHRLYMI